MTEPGGGRARHLWIRAEASPTIGLGHVMRSMAIAEAARSAGLGVTYVGDAGNQLQRLPERHGFGTRDGGGEGWSWLDSVLPGDAALFDGYNFTQGNHQTAASRGARVGAIDDIGEGRFDVDVLVNPNPIASPAYRLPAGASLLLGPEYAPVRAAFVGQRRARPGGTGVLLVTLGGSDAAGVTETVLRVLEKERWFARTLLVRGPAAGPIDIGRATAEWLEVVTDPDDVAVTFDRADAAVSAAGATTWELLAMGVPTALIKVADNQREVIRVADHGAALLVGNTGDVVNRLPPVLARLADTDEQRSLSRAGMSLVDGRGAQRVLRALFGGSIGAT